MNILVLNGSPHGDRGDSAALTRMVTGRLPGETVSLFLYGMSLSPCLGCGGCRSTQSCVLDADDDMGTVVEKLRWSDVVLLASPLHFTSLSGPLVCCIGRLQRFWNSGGPGGKPRRGGLVATGGALYREMFEPARRVAAAAFVTLGVEWRGMATAGDTDRVPVAENPDALASADALAAALAEG